MVNVDLGGTQTATLEIKDSSGTVVDRITVTQSGKIEIDKQNYNGSSSYTVEIAYPNTSAYFYSEGEITGVVNKNGQPQLKMGDTVVSSSNIIELHQS